MDWEKYIQIDPKYFRPPEVAMLLADASKARRQLGWAPRVTFTKLVPIIFDYDLEATGLKYPREGKEILRQKEIDWTRNLTTTAECHD